MSLSSYPPLLKFPFQALLCEEPSSRLPAGVCDTETFGLLF